MREINISVRLKTVSPELIDKEFNILKRETLEESQKIIISEIRTEINVRNMRVTDDMLESWEAVPLTAIGDIWRAVVSSDDIAAAVAEYKSVPATSGIVNVFEIRDWLKNKGISSSYGTIDQFAFALAKKIGKHGLPLTGGPRRPFNVAQKRAKRQIERLWNTEVEKMVRRLEMQKK